MPAQVYKKKLCMTEFHIAMPHFESTQFIDTSEGQPHDTFIYVINGSVTLSTPTKTLQVKKGELMFIPEGLRYYAVWRGDNGNDFYSLRIISKKADIADKSAFALQKVDISQLCDVKGRLDEIYRLFSTEKKVNLLRALGIYYVLYADILPLLEPARTPKYSAAVLAAAHFIDEHFAEDLSIDELAAHCHISASHLHHLFSAQMGTTPTKYRNALRVERAAADLRIDGLSIDAVAERNGFNSAAYFREIFKSETGLSPSEYRASARRMEM